MDKIDYLNPKKPKRTTPLVDKFEAPVGEVYKFIDYTIPASSYNILEKESEKAFSSFYINEKKAIADSKVSEKRIKKAYEETRLANPQLEEETLKYAFFTTFDKIVEKKRRLAKDLLEHHVNSLALDQPKP